MIELATELVVEQDQTLNPQSLDLVLPKVPLGKRIIPNDFVRSSLFTIGNRNKERAYLKEKPLYTFGDTHITYTGEELRQDDADVWMQLIAIASKAKQQEIEFFPYSVLKTIDWPIRTQFRDKLKDSILRMSATNIIIQNKKLAQGLAVSLVRKFVWRDEDGIKLKKWKIWLEPEILNLFADCCFSKILWEQRRKLSPLAKWLHSYYSTHAEPFAIKIDTIHNACGSSTKAIKHFKVSLRSALIELVQMGFLTDFGIGANNLVSVVRQKNKQQLYHNDE